MRLLTAFLVIAMSAVPAAAGTHGWGSARLSLLTFRIDFSKAMALVTRDADRETAGALLSHGAHAARSIGDGGTLFGLQVGPFQASFAGFDGAHEHLTPNAIDDRDFWNANAGGGADARGGRVMFTLPVR
ncbi:MAG: hypothetical protein ABSD74_09255 [Rhizomicrobium sp.]|jgi:hypothetical protein